MQLIVLSTFLFFPSSIVGSSTFTTARNVVNRHHSPLPMNNVYPSSQQPTQKIQNYFPYRCATYQRVNDFSNAPFKFIKKQPNILASYPGLFYSRNKSTMNNQSNVQEYRRYRDSQSHLSRKVGTIHQNLSDMNKDCYLRHRFHSIIIQLRVVI